MSQALTDGELLTIWERGLALGATERALIALSVGDAKVDFATARGLPLGQRDAQLLELRLATFGARLANRTRCPKCEAELEFELDVGDLRRDAPAADAAAPLRAEDAGLQIELRMPTSADLCAIERLRSVQEAEAELWNRCVSLRDARGERVAPASLDASQRATVEALLENLDPRIDPAIELQCQSCEFRWTTPYDIARIFWEEIAQYARGVLREVHTLARRYGWSEREVLALSRARRELYLSLVE